MGRVRPHCCRRVELVMTHRNPPLFSVKSIGSNQTEVIHGEVRVLVSYETPVAVHVSGVGYYVTDKKWSSTTTRHINKWLRKHGASKAEKISQKALEHMASTGEEE